MKIAMKFQSLDLDKWTVTGSLSLPYAYPAACTVNSVPEIIMSGGVLNNSNVDTMTDTTYTRDGVSFEFLPDMPLALFSHCIVALDGDDMFVTGGYVDYSYQYNNQSFLYHSDTMEWERLKDMPTARSTLMCAMVHNEEGDQEVIIVGGNANSDESDLYDTYDTNVTEIYNLKTREWRTGQLNALKICELRLIIMSFQAVHFLELLSAVPLLYPWVMPFCWLEAI